MSTECAQCQVGTLGWSTRTTGGPPVDVYGCERCGAVLIEEDWEVPAHPPGPGSCRNCGGARVQGVCTACGLSETEDAQVHDELRRLVDPEADLLGAALTAAEAGRRLLALKLASAAQADGQDPARARLMRLDLLQELGLMEVAVQDCRVWVNATGGRDPLSWLVLAEALVALGRASEALEGLERSLALEPDQPAVRARLAGVLLGLSRYAMAREHALRVLLEPDAPPAHAMAREVMGQYLERLMAQDDQAAVQEHLEELDEHVRLDARLSCARAWLDLRLGQPRAAQLALERAQRLDRRCPQLPGLRAELEALERRQKKPRWWDWPA